VGGRGKQVKAIGGKASPLPPSCIRVHNGVAKSGICLVCPLLPRIKVLCSVVYLYV